MDCSQNRAAVGFEGVPSQEDAVQLRVVDRVDRVLAQQADELELVDEAPGLPRFEERLQLAPAVEDPPAPFRRRLQAGQERRRVVVPIGAGGGQDAFAGHVKKLAAEFADLGHPPGPRRRRRLADPTGQVGRLEPIGPFQAPGDLGGLDHQIPLDGVLGGEVVDPLLDLAFQLGRAFLRQDRA